MFRYTMGVILDVLSARFRFQKSNCLFHLLIILLASPSLASLIPRTEPPPVPHLYASDLMTTELCWDYCANLEYTFAVLEYQNECWCGNKPDLSGGESNGMGTRCRLACSGDPEQLCGGSSQGQLYQKNPNASTCTGTTTGTATPTSIATVTATSIPSSAVMGTDTTGTVIGSGMISATSTVCMASTSTVISTTTVITSSINTSITVFVTQTVTAEKETVTEGPTTITKSITKTQPVSIITVTVPVLDLGSGLGLGLGGAVHTTVTETSTITAATQTVTLGPTTVTTAATVTITTAQQVTTVVPTTVTITEIRTQNIGGTATETIIAPATATVTVTKSAQETVIIRSSIITVTHSATSVIITSTVTGAAQTTVTVTIPGTATTPTATATVIVPAAGTTTLAFIDPTVVNSSESTVNPTVDPSGTTGPTIISPTSSTINPTDTMVPSSTIAPTIISPTIGSALTTLSTIITTPTTSISTPTCSAIIRDPSFETHYPSYWDVSTSSPNVFGGITSSVSQSGRSSCVMRFEAGASIKSVVSLSQSVVLCDRVRYAVQAFTLISSPGCRLSISIGGIIVAVSSNDVGGGWKGTRQVATVYGTGIPVILKVFGTCDVLRIGRLASNMMLDDIALHVVA
ncbi:hypothetical protein DFP73DRAFT_620186, partial [Morchella snyderi]